MEPSCSPLERLVAGCAARGIALDGFRREFLTRRLVRSATLAGEVFLDRTVERLLERPAELSAFVEELSICASSFFRDPLPFAWLEQTLLPALDRQAGPVRVWSAGCARGEEPWSLAMLLAERRSDFEVLGSDRSEHLLAGARAGLYGLDEIGGVTVGRARRFLQQEEERFRIVEELRPRVTFVRHDLAQPPPGDDFDLVLCRNVLIYLTPEAKQVVLGHLVQSVRQGGHLVLGQAELAPQGFGLAAVEPSARIYRKDSP